MRLHEAVPAATARRGDCEPSESVREAVADGRAPVPGLCGRDRLVAPAAAGKMDRLRDGLVVDPDTPPVGPRCELEDRHALALARRNSRVDFVVPRLGA